MRSWHGNLSPFGTGHTGRDLEAAVRGLLFGNNELGFMAIISPEVCFANVAGTIPAALNAAVARVNDTSGRGNHLTQPTLANRPFLGRRPQGGRRNILRGTSTLVSQTRAVLAGQHTLSFRGTGTVTLSGVSTAGPLVGTGADDIVSLTFTTTTGGLTLIVTVAGTVNDAQLERGAVRSAYQRVGLSTDVTEEGKPDRYYLFFGGAASPRWLQTAALPAPLVDKAQVFAGVRKITNAAGTLAELGNGEDSNTGVFVSTVENLFGASSRGSAPISSDQLANTGVVLGANSSVITATHDISGDLTRIRRNGEIAGTATGDKGAGNFNPDGTDPIFVGSRAGTSSFLDGDIYAMITRFGSNLTTAEIEKVETLIANAVAEGTI